MKITTQQETLLVYGLERLGADNAFKVRDAIRAELKHEHRVLRIDFAKLDFLDSSGLGALISLQKSMAEQNGKVQLVNPTDTSLQILELTRLHRIFEIVRIQSNDA